MAINSPTRTDRELSKFVESPTRPGEPAVEVVSGNTGGLPFAWNAFTVDRTDSLDDVFNYTYNASGVGSVTITYTDTNKDIIAGGNIVVL